MTRHICLGRYDIVFWDGDRENGIPAMHIRKQRTVEGVDDGSGNEDAPAPESEYQRWAQRPSFSLKSAMFSPWKAQ